MIIRKYRNGDFNFTLHKDGTLIRETDVENPHLDYPSSIDVKITDYCDMGCRYCHESSTIAGKHADLDKLLQTISALPAGTELAIGGGNPLSHPNLIFFLIKLKDMGIIANITINQGHLKTYEDMIRYLIRNELVYGVGISITSSNFKYVTPILKMTSNVVFHVIAGVNKVEIMDDLLSLTNKCKVLVLGYKTFGFGVYYHSTEVDAEIKKWFMYLPRYIGKCVLSFDNLAIEQLNVRRLFTAEGWQRFYMGNDFEFTMYIDAVKQQYAPTSRSIERKSFKDISLKDYFNTRIKR